MTADAPDLAAESLRGDDVVLRRPDVPLLPAVAAAPSGDDEDPLAVARLEEVGALEHPLEANRVEAHRLDVLQLGAIAVGLPPQEQVAGPARSPDQQGDAVDGELGVPVGGDLALDLADPERETGL